MAASIDEENDQGDVMVPLEDTEATKSSVDETPKIDTFQHETDTHVPLALRQKRQQEAQLAFLKEQGLIDEDECVDVAIEKVVANTAQVAADDVYTQAKNAARKAGVAAAGGALVAVGAVLTPLPTPGGILLAGAGLGVLSTEFECAKKALDSGKEKLVGLIDSIPEEENPITKQQEKDENGEISRQDTLDSQDVSVASTDVSKTSSKATTTTNNTTSEVRASLRGQARRIGKSIRPFLTDEDAPRQAMEDLNAATKRAASAATDKAYNAASFTTNKAYDVVKFILVLDEFDPSNQIKQQRRQLQKSETSLTEETATEDVVASNDVAEEETEEESEANKVSDETSSLPPSPQGKEDAPPAVLNSTTTDNTVVKEANVSSLPLQEALALS